MFTLLRRLSSASLSTLFRENVWTDGLTLLDLLD